MKSVRSILPLLLQLAIVAGSFAQQSRWVNDIIGKTSIDSLITTVRELDGEQSVLIGGVQTRIINRQYSSTPHPEITSYLNARIAAQGFTAQQLRVRETCVSLLVEDPGTDASLAPVIFCAHIDAGDDGSSPPSEPRYTPGADDDASGVATVLEALRIMKHYPHRRTVIFALWDGEEFGRQGSVDYAIKSQTQGKKIQGVLNVDMIGYDANNDGVAHVYPGKDAGSLAIRDTLFYVNSAYNIGLALQAPRTNFPGTDAVSFQLSGFSAAVLIEDFHNDENPYGHKASDLSTAFNLPYYLKCAKLAIGSLAQLADIEGEITAIAPTGETPKAFSLDQNYPNPFNPSTMISFSIPSRAHVSLKIFDVVGRKVATLVNETLPSGAYSRSWNASGMPSGVYFYRLVAGLHAETKRLMILK